VTRNERAAPLIWGFLLASLLVGLAVIWLTPPHSRGSMLALAILATLACFGVTVFVVGRTARFAGVQVHPLQRSSAWQVLSRSQWLALTIGVTMVAALTSVGTGLRIAANAGTPSANPTTVVTPSPTPPPTTSTPTPPGPTDTSTGGPSGSGSESQSAGPGAGPAGRITYLDSLRPVDGYYDANPINLSGKRYPRSVGFYCSSPTYSYVEWNVAGSQEFRATIGIADNTSDAFGRIVEMIFYDQDGHQLGKTVDVSVGHPVPVTLPLTGVVHMRVVCSARDAKTSAETRVYGAMGDALIVSG
jgi:hypothetical protein